MAIDTHKDGWSTLDRIALNAEGRRFKSDNLRNVTDLDEFRQRCSRMSAVFFGEDEITSEVQLQLEILDLIQRAKRIARAMKLPQAMEVHHQIGMAIHGSAQR